MPGDSLSCISPHSSMPYLQGVAKTPAVQGGPWETSIKKSSSDNPYYCLMLAYAELTDNEKAIVDSLIEFLKNAADNGKMLADMGVWAQSALGKYTPDGKPDETKTFPDDVQLQKLAAYYSKGGAGDEETIAGKPAAQWLSDHHRADGSYVFSRSDMQVLQTAAQNQSSTQSNIGSQVQLKINQGVQLATMYQTAEQSVLTVLVQLMGTLIRAMSGG